MNLVTKNTTIPRLAVALLLCAGTLHRWVHATRASLAGLNTPPARPLSEVPARLGPWVLAREVPLEREVLDVLAADSFIQRDYVDSTSGRHLLLYVGYWGRQNVGAGHGPEVCYPLVGWSIASPPRQQHVRLDPARRGSQVPIALHRFVRTEPEGIDRRAVAFVAVLNGQYRTSSRGAFWHRPPGGHHGAAHYLAHVQVSASAPNGQWSPAESEILAFMKLVLPHLSKCLPGPTKQWDSEGPT